MQKTVLLISGIPLKQGVSFYYQLSLLGTWLTKRGYRVALSSRPPGNRENTPMMEHYRGIREDMDMFFIKDLRPRTFHQLVQHTGAAAAILLGYPSQFNFLHQAPVPVFLWAQFSGPPSPGSLGSAVPVPLTPTTRVHLVNAGVKHIGPVIPHGVDTSLFSPFSLEEKNRLKKQWGLEEHVVVGTVGANTARKQLSRVIEVFFLFMQQTPSPLKTSLVIKTDRAVSADGCDIKASTIHRATAAHNTILVTDQLSCRQMAELYNRMDVYVHLAEWEGFGIPAAEAMACGVPVITHPVQGPGELIPYPE
ncbi:MAG: glycosyltransferase family 4 protein, partial [Spirochaetota bacterium]